MAPALEVWLCNNACYVVTELFEIMGEKDIDDVNEGLNESDDNLYGPCFTVNFGLYDIPIPPSNN